MARDQDETDRMSGDLAVSVPHREEQAVVSDDLSDSNLSATESQDVREKCRVETARHEPREQHGAEMNGDEMSNSRTHKDSSVSQRGLDVRRRSGPRRSSSAPVGRHRTGPLPTFMLPPDPFDHALPSCPKQAFMSVERSASRGLIMESDQFGWSSRKTLPDYYYQNAGTTDMPGQGDAQADEEREARRSKRKDRQNLPSYSSPRCFANPKNNGTLLTPIMETKFKNGSLALTQTGRIGLVTEYTLTNNSRFRAIRFDVDGINGVSDGHGQMGHGQMGHGQMGHGQIGHGHMGQGPIGHPDFPGYQPGGVPTVRPDSGRVSAQGSGSSSSRRRAQLPFFYGGKRPGVKSHSCLPPRPMTT